METIQKYFKVDKKNIAFLKFVLEAYDGMAVIRTLNPREGVIELMIAPDFEKDVENILDSLRDEVEILSTDPPAYLEEL